MRVGIVGAGFTGLTAALDLINQGIKVEVFEASDSVGGLAGGFSLPDWDWPIEHFYHHIFSNDRSIISLSKKVGWPPIFFRPTTAIYYDGHIYPFDSPLHLLSFPHLTLQEKLRMGAVLGFLKANPWWQPLEQLKAHDFLIKSMGSSGYKKIWEPLLKAKFSNWARQVNTAWFWARIKKRTPRLGYFQHGFRGLADQIKEQIINKGGKVYLDSPVFEIQKKRGRFILSSKVKQKSFNKILMTTGISQFLKLVKELPTGYRKKLLKLKSLATLSVVFVLKKPLMNGVYWLNVADTSLPFVVIAEHTNMINVKHYGGNHIVYLGAYLPANHQYFTLSKSSVINLAKKQLGKIVNNFDESIILDSFIFSGKEAQPVVPVNYSSIKPEIKTPIDNLFLANQFMVYPWDRGTNYAVELGEKVADLILR